MDVFGHTRSRIGPGHALITPDTHVVAPLVGWENTSAVMHISPELGARFLQYTAVMEAGGKSGPPGENTERMVYVVEGQVRVSVGEEQSKPSTLSAGGYAYLPPNAEHQIMASEAARLLVFEKLYQPSPAGAPGVVIGNQADVEAEAFLGDSDARLKTLLPVSPEFDMAVNVFTYQPGATLPQVEIHVMEHGLMMLEGAGVYRLGDDYYPVQAGDVIWMASYCPQWFVAMGKLPASYIYYKDIHRDRIEYKL